jgi:hypothetical protein
MGGGNGDKPDHLSGPQEIAPNARRIKVRRPRGTGKFHDEP